MLHPVGSQPPSVYWRRRLVLIGAVVLVIVLIALTVSALSGGGSPSAAATSSADVPRPTGPAPHPTTSAARSSASAPARSSSGTASSSASGSGSRAAMPATCSLADLSLVAVVGKKDYKVGEKPLVELQVTNTGAKPCVRELADKQIELRVYNGTSRVWGSHDCAVQPGTDKRTLAVGQPYRFAILWGGLTSQVGCKQTTRQRVGAGTYTLYASLSGKSGKAAQFNIS